MSFPEDFTWGVSAASYQIEGAALEDGKGESVWDMFCRREGAVDGGHNGETACDHYHRYKEDVALMKELGARAYRLSLSWPRILPEGRGALNPKGVDFYNRLLDELRAAGIQPWITLFHWDYPYALFQRGGWLHPDSPEWFAEFAATAAKLFSGRCRHWVTMNEPQCFIGLGHQSGEHAPGLQLPLREVLQCARHAMLAHGKAVQALRANSKTPCQVGYAAAGQVKIPATQKQEDIAAARRAFGGVFHRNCWNNAWWMDPVYSGRYPEDGLRLFGKDAPEILPGDMETIAQPLDFCAVNVYQGRLVRADVNGEPQEVPPPPGYNRTAQDDWHVTPDSLYWTPKWLHERYKLPVVITENGHQNLDAVFLDGRVHDPQRIDYLIRHLQALKKTMDEGAPVKGYFVWTLLDNFEWALGYKVRVGLVYTDYQTLRRIPKDSFYWYQKVIASHGRNLQTAD